MEVVHAGLFHSERVNERVQNKSSQSWVASAEVQMSCDNNICVLSSRNDIMFRLIKMSHFWDEHNSPLQFDPVVRIFACVCSNVFQNRSLKGERLKGERTALLPLPPSWFGQRLLSTVEATTKLAESGEIEPWLQRSLVSCSDIHPCRF